MKLNKDLNARLKFLNHRLTHLSFLILIVLLVGCERERRRVVFVRETHILRDYYAGWIKDGGMTNGDHSIYQFLPTNYFLFTNQIQVEGRIYHCLIGYNGADRDLPPGLLTLTKEGTFLFINDKTKKVIVSPEKTGKYK